MSNKWTVTTTHQNLDRKWGIRFEYVGLEYVLVISLKPLAPAARIVIFGCSVVFGRIRQPLVNKVTSTFVTGVTDIAKSLQKDMSTQITNNLDNKMWSAMQPYVNKDIKPIEGTTIEGTTIERLRSAATAIYGHRWVCADLSYDRQIAMWDELRDAIGLPPGTATGMGVGGPKE